MHAERTNRLLAFSIGIMLFQFTRPTIQATKVPFHEAAGVRLLDERCEECPSYCDETGAKHDPVSCRLVAELSYCCDFVIRLDCCTNETLMLSKDEAMDGFRCSSSSSSSSSSTVTYGRTVMFVCVPVGMACFVVVVALFIYQRRRKTLMTRNSAGASDNRRRRRPSDVSCSSQGSQSSIGSSHVQYPMDSIYGGGIDLQLQQQQPAIVISTAHLEDNRDDVAFRVLQRMRADPTATPQTDIYVIQSCVYPPPYTDDTPPLYADIFPS